MKVIDRTPLQNEKGEFSPLQRIQGTLEHGFNWFPELEAQRVVVTQLDSVLEKGFTLIRNLTLHNSQIVVPLILIGAPGVFVIRVTPIAGLYEAKGDQWNVTKNGHSYPEPINLLTQTSRLARALTVFIERQGINLPGPVEPILIATNPGMHIDSLRPAVRIVLSDGVKQFAASLLQARPVLKTELVYDLAERIITPRPKASAQGAQGASQTPEPPMPSFAASPSVQTGPPGFAGSTAQPGSPFAPEPSRARAIFHAAEESKPFDPNDLSFAFDEKAGEEVPENLREPSPSQRLAAPDKKPTISSRQWILLGAMMLVECCILAGFGFLIFRFR
jgi:hypothetical protein